MDRSQKRPFVFWQVLIIAGILLPSGIADKGLADDGD
jgi:hypothetical protein